jgi:hypothetical protein
MGAVLLLDPEGATGPTVAAIGDIGVIGSVRARARRYGYDSILASAAGALRAADLGFANLEFPIGEPEWVRPGRSPEFWHEPDVVKTLARSGVRVVSLANNHAMDCGTRGLERTLEVCAAAGVAAIGAGSNVQEARRPARLEIAGRRIAIAAYTASGETHAGPASPGTAPLGPEVLREDLEPLRATCDVLIVSVHWGSMYVDHPPERVLELARLIAPWSDLTLGHHPHVTQGYCRLGRNLTLFSLGDACFDPRAGEIEAMIASDTRRETGVFTAVLADGPGLSCLPLFLDPDGVPEAADAPRAAAQIARLQRISTGLAEGRTRFAEQSAPQLLRYELQSLFTHLRRGRVDRALRLLATIRPRHLPLLWSALLRMRRR